MIVSLLFYFVLGMSIPVLASRFGKVMPNEPGTMICLMPHRPHFPHSTNAKRVRLLKSKWQKMLLFSIGWGIVLSGLAMLADLWLPADGQVFFMIFFYMVGLLMAIDQQYFLLPDFLTIPLLFLGFGFAAITGLITPLDSFIGAVYGYLISVISVLVMRLISSKNSEFGGGDVKMLTALGAWVGFEPLNYILVTSFVLFAVQALVKKNKVGAFGPALGAASILILLFIY